jgi:hypothetical protein
LHEYDFAGHEVAHQSLPLLPFPEASYAQALFGLFTPPAEALALISASRCLRAEARADGGTQKSVLLHDLETSKYFIPGISPSRVAPSGLVPAYLALMLLMATASALGNFLLARRHAYSSARCAAWTMCGLFFGWVGIALMLAVEEWPARIPCRSCRRFRVVTCETCEHCGAAHSRPNPDGTEIFEPASAVPSLALAAR